MEKRATGASVESFAVQPGDLEPIDDLTWDLQCLGLRKILESIVGEDMVIHLYTIAVFLVSGLIAFSLRSRKSSLLNQNRKAQFRYALYVMATLCFVGVCFVMVGYGMGYTTGYGERISVEQLNSYQLNMASMAMRIFWSFLLSCGIAFMYSFTSSSLPCCN